MENVKTEKQLNTLLETTYDAQRGFANAAEVTKHVQLKRWLAQQGARRTEFAAVLAGKMKGMNQNPINDGTVAGDMHRGWMNIKTALSLNKDESVLEECLSGEKNAVKEYNKVLEHKSELPPTIVSVLEAQKDEIQATVNKVRSLEHFAHEHNL
ncbi:PA2169 family four-helix-bundle protein [uncultured Nonlabens sp.]|uniref:ferritin-like domain-containing protein n=1 Tax=uncultured Nonlabens sp. TaxID=859306 RepID=UPI0026298070|nr:PA2169 family four-helix-bundle protein [uncultured Nonlabens sp.]